MSHFGWYFEEDYRAECQMQNIQYEILVINAMKSQE